MTLHLTLKKKWFDMIASGEKTEEYREIKEYWEQRLLVKNDLGEVIGNRPFAKIVAKNGYGNVPTLTAEFLGVTIGTGKPEWGAEPGKKYFYHSYRGETMSCEICGRGNCTRSFHSSEEVENFDNAADSIKDRAKIILAAKMNRLDHEEIDDIVYVKLDDVIEIINDYD